MAASMPLLRFWKFSTIIYKIPIFRTENVLANTRKVHSLTLHTARPAQPHHCSTGNRLYSTGGESKKVTKTEETGKDADEADAEKEESKPQVPVHDVQTSIRYLNSKAYKMTYGDAHVWQPYRRNHKGGIPPEKTRKSCIRKGVIATGNPCPICRDEYLVLHPENVPLLKQFIAPTTGQVLSYQKTGYIDSVVPFRQYDYEEYYPQLKRSQNEGGNKKTSLS